MRGRPDLRMGGLQSDLRQHLSEGQPGQGHRARLTTAGPSLGPRRPSAPAAPLLAESPRPGPRPARACSMGPTPCPVSKPAATSASKSARVGAPYRPAPGARDWGARICGAHSSTRHFQRSAGFRGTCAPLLRTARRPTSRRRRCVPRERDVSGTCGGAGRPHTRLRSEARWQLLPQAMPALCAAPCQPLAARRGCGDTAARRRRLHRPRRCRSSSTTTTTR